jgi:cation:H+ antiporter
MGLNITFLFLGLLLLFTGAEGLVRGSSALSLRLGLTPLVIGLTVVAFGTSAPELIVSLTASLNAQGDIAIGNIVGSNIFNIGMIIGLTAIICPIPVNLTVIKIDAPIMIVVSFTAVCLINSGMMSFISGLVLVTGLIAYVGVTIWLARKESTEKLQTEFSSGIASPSGSFYRDIFFIVAGLVLLITGSRLLVISATAIAQSLYINEAVIGLTIVAAGTSLPELATSMIAAVRRQPDIAIGNIVGSNIFNILGILGITSIVSPLSATGVKTLDLWVMVVLALALLPLLWTGRKLMRWEGGLLLAGYALYLWMLWPR